jgi:hypothetical protein
MPSGHSQPEISSTPLSSVRCIVFVNSETEPESEGPYPNDDQESMIKNQARLPEFQDGIPKSSPPPPASDNVNHNVSNNGEFFLKKRCARTEFLVS